MFVRKPTRSSFIDKAGCTQQFESELSLRSFAQLFPVKEVFFRKPTSPPVPLPLREAPPLISVFSNGLYTPSVPLVGDRNLREEEGNRPTRCSEPLRSKVLADNQRSSPYCAGWDRLAVMGISLQLYC